MKRLYLWCEELPKPNKMIKNYDAGQVPQLTDDSIEINTNILFLPLALELNC